MLSAVSINTVALIPAWITETDLDDASAAYSCDFSSGELPLDYDVVRNSIATYFDHNSILRTVVGDEPRFGYNQITRKRLGIITEPSTQNNCLQSRDLSNASWVKTNVTAVKDAIGIDAVGNSASTLTATAINGTVTQAITLTIRNATFSAYIRRKTGAGTIEITDNNFVAVTDITALINSITYTRVRIKRNQANPVIGFRIGTSGDEIEVDFCQDEDGLFASSPREALTVPVIRDAENISNTNIPWYIDGGPGTVLTKSVAPSLWETNDLSAQGIGGFSNAVANDEQIFFGLTASGLCRLVYRKTTVVQADLQSITQVVADQEFKMMSAWDVNDFAMSRDGAVSVVDNLGDLTTGIDRLTISNGFSGAGGFQFIGGVKKFIYWQKREANSQIESKSIL